MQDKWLPLPIIGGGGLTIELNLGNLTDCFAEAGADWSISDCKLLCSWHTIDANFANSYAAHTLAGKPLVVPLTGIFSSLHVVTTEDFDVNVVRGFSRVSQVYSTLFRTGTGKLVNNFWHPGVGDALDALSPAYDVTSLQLAIGPKLYPLRAIDRASHFMYYLLASQGILNGTDTCGITTKQYRSNRFIACIDVTKCGSDAAYSGQSTKGGEIMQASWKKTKGGGGDFPTHCHIVQVFESMIQIQDGMVTYLD